ncbi:MAG: fibronectin type III domain-containing protein, partial [Flavobacteriaceae bacterium]|nr:fibronectin type III domain-containing protein [Flavobacteriaceae bacterium]
LSENAVFKNNGYSEIYHFEYNKDCKPPRFALASPESSGRVKVQWQGDIDHQRYMVQYRKSGVEDAEWFSVKTRNSQAQIGNLQSGTSYEFRVGGSCDAITALSPSYTYTAIQEFGMPSKEEAKTYSCGIVPEIEISNTAPLENLGVNEVFTAGDFPVTVKIIEGEQGNYSGKGYIVVPYLADTKIAVEFKNIRINTDYQLVEGKITTTYDATWGGVSDVQETIDDVVNLLEQIEQALKLDIDKDTKEKIDKVVAALVNNISQEDFPEALKQEAIETAKKLSESKQKLDTANANGDSAGADAAKKEFSESQKELSSSKKKMEAYKKEVKNLLKRAITALYREGRDLEQKLFEELQSFDLEPFEEVEGLFLVPVEVELPISAEMQRLNVFNTTAKKHALIRFAAILHNENLPPGVFQGFITKAKTYSHDLLGYIKTKKEAKTKDAAIVLGLKEELQKVFVKILENS